MSRLALAVGTTLLESGFPEGAERREVETRSGTVALLDAGDYLVLQRHGLDSYTPPHLIDHAANLEALVALGCGRAIAIGSVGALHPELGVGTLLAPDDFIALQLGLTSFGDARGHRVPGLDAPWRREVVEAWSARAQDAPLRDGGVYWQATGPRFETPAEIRLIAAHADVIGMTIASECVIAGELGIDYAAICVVDNLANGVGERPLSENEVLAGVAANRDRVLGALEAVLPRLAEAHA